MALTKHQKGLIGGTIGGIIADRLATLAFKKFIPKDRTMQFIKRTTRGSSPFKVFKNKQFWALQLRNQKRNWPILLASIAGMLIGSHLARGKNND